jgi:NCS2 family nucleobase:cation symporter-2
MGAFDAVRGPAAAALVHPEAEGTGLIPTRVLSDELAAEQGGDGMPVDASSIRDDDPTPDRETGQAPRD